MADQEYGCPFPSLIPMTPIDSALRRASSAGGRSSSMTAPPCEIHQRGAQPKSAVSFDHRARSLGKAAAPRSIPKIFNGAGDAESKPAIRKRTGEYGGALGFHAVQLTSLIGGRFEDDGRHAHGQQLERRLSAGR